MPREGDRKPCVTAGCGGMTTFSETSRPPGWHADGVAGAYGIVFPINEQPGWTCAVNPQHWSGPLAPHWSEPVIRENRPLLAQDDRVRHEASAHEWLTTLFRFLNGAADAYLQPLNRLGEIKVGNHLPAIEIRTNPRLALQPGTTRFVAITYVAGARVFAVSERYHSPGFDNHDLDIDLVFNLSEHGVRLKAFPDSGPDEFGRLLWDEFVFRDQRR